MSSATAIFTPERPSSHRSTSQRLSSQRSSSSKSPMALKTLNPMESSQTFMKSTNKRLTQLKTPSRKRLKVEFAIKPEIDQESTVIKLAQQDNNDHVSQDHISNNLTEELANIPLLSPNKSQTVDVGGYLFSIEVVNLLQDRQGVNIMDQSWTLRDVASSLFGHDNHINIDELVFRDETGCEFQLETLACSLSQNMSYYLLDTKTS